MFKQFSLVCLALLLSFTFACANNNSNKTAAPDFTLQSIDGKMISLSDFKGKMVFLDFWATWCPPCRASIPAVKELHAKFAGREDIVIIGINVGESKETVINFVKQNNINYMTLLADKSVTSKYSISGIPRFIIIGKDGNILKNFTGYSQGMEAEWIKILETK